MGCGSSAQQQSSQQDDQEEERHSPPSKAPAPAAASPARSAAQQTLPAPAERQPSTPSPRSIRLRSLPPQSASPGNAPNGQVDPLLNSPPKKAAFDPKALRLTLANGAAPVARPTLASPKAAYTVESLFKAAHDGHDMGRKAALLFEKFDTDHNGILDLQELTALTKAMLENTLKTLIEANNEMVSKAIKERPEDEQTIRSEAKIELDMIVPYAQSQIARAGTIAKEISDHMDADGNGQIDKEEFINQVTDCLKTYADFNVC